MRRRFTMMVLAPNIGVSLLLLAVGAVAAWHAHRMNRDVSNSVAETLAASSAADQIFDELRDLRRGLDRFADSGDAAHLDTVAAQIPQIARLLQTADKGPVGADWQALRDRRRENFELFRQRLDDLLESPQRREPTVTARELVRFLDRSVLTSAEALADVRAAAAAASSRNNQANTSRVGVSLLLLGICGAIGGLLAGYGIARVINQRVVQLSLQVRDMAGELDQVVGPIRVLADGDLSELEYAMRTLAAKTADVVRNLQESRQQTVRAEQLAAIGQLAAGLAHELRNPLMSLKLLVQTARERGEAGGLQPRDLAVMEEEIQRQEKLLQTFLDFARPPQPQVATLDASQLIEKTIQLLEPRATQQRVRIDWEHDEMPAIEGDESLLRQVLLNLLLNALDASPQEGAITIRSAVVGACLPDPSGEAAPCDALVLRISDEGPGLAADTAPRIFEPFVSTKPLGLGLGLSVSSRIVQAHGGNLTARNREGGGAEFTLRLPIRRETPPALETPGVRALPSNCAASCA